ncbi:lamin tail domain-containing protein, partial [Myxococcota bacterium]|nr:lamin tail domain-containing protein [Myxococcota bacterium]
SLFFSEYVEGGSNNKALEIYNATGSSIPDLSVCEIWQYNGGSSTVSYTYTFPAGALANETTFVVCDDDADETTLQPYCDDLSSTQVVQFNGNDALELVCDDGTGSMIVFDIIGKIGEDPGTEWGTGVVSTQNNTIRRKAGITVGDINGTDDFNQNLIDEWDGFAEDTFDGLGLR